MLFGFKSTLPMCTHCLVAIVQIDMQLDRSTYEVLQILSISLTDKTHLRDLFERTKFQNDKERFRLSEPNLFNFLYRPNFNGTLVTIYISLLLRSYNIIISPHHPVAS